MDNLSLAELQLMLRAGQVSPESVETIARGREGPDVIYYL